LTRKITGLTQRTYETSQRPYIGVSGMGTTYTYTDKNGERKSSAVPVKDSSAIAFQAEIKNFGPVPGTNFTADWKVYWNGDEMHSVKQIPETPYNLYPSEIAILGGTIWGDQYKSLMAETATLEVEVSVSYDGPAGHYAECGK